MLKYIKCELCNNNANVYCSECGYDLCDYCAGQHDKCPSCYEDMRDDDKGWVEHD